MLRRKSDRDFEHQPGFVTAAERPKARAHREKRRPSAMTALTKTSARTTAAIQPAASAETQIMFLHPGKNSRAGCDPARPLMKTRLSDAGAICARTDQPAPNRLLNL